MAGTVSNVVTRRVFAQPLRVGFDMDGVVADLATAFREADHRLFGAAETEEVARRAAEVADVGNAGPDAVALQAAWDAERRRVRRRRRDQVWRSIRSTPDFWTLLEPLEEGGVARIQEMARRYHWEVCFITQRPYTNGYTVQRQTQRWLVEHGFELPSVLVLGGSRGAAARVLRLDYHLDDSPQNCLDVIGESNARPILVVPDDDKGTIASARKLGIGTARSLSACLDILERASMARLQPDVLASIGAAVGWK